jgi:alkylation response protein AidB-like acyl-CoA dehydrogenase
MTFRSPVRDLAFSLTEVAGADRLIETGAYPDLDTDTISAVLEAAGQLSDDILAPLNRPGDLTGAKYANGSVTAAPGFGDAYKVFAAGGWNGLAADPEYGGQGLPKALELACYETFHAANMAFGLCPMLTLASIEALHEHGTPRQKSLYMSRMISGEWTGAMVLTESHSGSDLGTLRTVAHPNGDGTYRLEGQKIFITWGEHDAPTTSSIWCSPACRMRRRERAASRCSWCRSSWSMTTARSAPATISSPIRSNTSSASTARPPAR